jgi:hypothetical protein
MKKLQRKIMINSIKNRDPLHLLASRKIIIISLAATALLGLILARIDTAMAGEGGPGVVYLQLAFTRANFEMVLASWGKKGIELFLDTLWIDFLYPLAYATLFASAQAMLLFRKRDHVDDITSWDRFWLLVPVVAALFDYMENILHYLILSFHLFNGYWIQAASGFALCKWTLLAITLMRILQLAFSRRK